LGISPTAGEIFHIPCSLDGESGWERGNQRQVFTPTTTLSLISGENKGTGADFALRAGQVKRVIVVDKEE